MQTVRCNDIQNTDRSDRRPLHGEPSSSTDHWCEGFRSYYWCTLHMTSESSVDGREVLSTLILKNG